MALFLWLAVAAAFAQSTDQALQASARATESSSRFLVKKI